MTRTATEKGSKKTFRWVLLIAFCFLMLIIGCRNVLFGSIPSIDKHDELLQVLPSPDETRIVEVYRDYGSATTCYAVICKVYGEDIRERNFFCLYHGTSADITWLDENHIFIDATTCGNEMYWKDVLPKGQDGIVLDLRGEWFDNGDLGGFGRDENGKVFLHRWWK